MAKRKKQRSTKHTPKAKDREHEPHLKPGVNSGAIYYLNLVEFLFLFIFYIRYVLTINNKQLVCMHSKACLTFPSKGTLK